MLARVLSFLNDIAQSLRISLGTAISVAKGVGGIDGVVSDVDYNLSSR
jgi:hypothetical protein